MFRTRPDGPNVIICVHLSSETGVVSAIAGCRDLLGGEGVGVHSDPFIPTPPHTRRHPLPV